MVAVHSLLHNCCTAVNTLSCHATSSLSHVANILVASRWTRFMTGNRVEPEDAKLAKLGLARKLTKVQYSSRLYTLPPRESSSSLRKTCIKPWGIANCQIETPLGSMAFCTPFNRRLTMRFLGWMWLARTPLSLSEMHPTKFQQISARKPDLQSASGIRGKEPRTSSHRVA